jgi:hypothetical protein
MISSLDAFVSGLFRAEPQTLFSLAVAVGSFLIYRRFTDGPTLLMVVGAIANFIIFSHGSFITYAALRHDWIALDSFAFSCWLFVHAIATVASICFPVGFLWHAWRRRSSNHAMERTSDRSTSTS